LATLEHQLKIEDEFGDKWPRQTKIESFNASIVTRLKLIAQIFCITEPKPG
jgi:hypothetical protein